MFPDRFLTQPSRHSQRAQLDLVAPVDRYPGHGTARGTNHPAALAPVVIEVKSQKSPTTILLLLQYPTIRTTTYHHYPTIIIQQSFLLFKYESILIH